MVALWEQFLDEHFPGYLLPESCRHAIDPDVASRFLERLSGRPAHLWLLRAVSALSPREEELDRFVQTELQEWARTLSGAVHVQQRQWRGGFQGKLDVPATLQRRLAGDPTLFITRSRKRHFDRPEDVFVCSIAKRLLYLFEELRTAGLSKHYGWSKALGRHEATVRHLLSSSTAREIPNEAIEPFHLQAAEHARKPVYRSALRWHRWLREALDEKDPEKIAAILAHGALTPLDEDTRFELTVALRFTKSVQTTLDTLAPGAWEYERPLVLPGRKEFAVFQNAAGNAVRIYYNQAVLPSGERDLGLRHYLDYAGRLRPDLTVLLERKNEPTRAVVVEIKNTNDRDYLVRGFEEALLYRAEYLQHLHTWPSAALVASGAIPGNERVGDPVVAVSWEKWFSAEFMHATLSRAVHPFPQ